MKLICYQQQNIPVGFKSTQSVSSSVHQQLTNWTNQFITLVIKGYNIVVITVIIIINTDKYGKHIKNNVHIDYAAN